MGMFNTAKSITLGMLIVFKYGISLFHWSVVISGEISVP